MLDTLLPRLSDVEILEHSERRPGLAFLRVAKAQLKDLLRVLTREHGFVTLTAIACTDRIEDGVFRLTYLLESEGRDRCLGVAMHIGRDGESVDTCLDLWPQAEIFERELHEMFGIPVANHPSLGDFMLEGWTHTPPMRREFDTLKFVQETFEFREGRDDNLDVRTEIRRRKEAKQADKGAAAGAQSEGAAEGKPTAPKRPAARPAGAKPGARAAAPRPAGASEPTAAGAAAVSTAPIPGGPTPQTPQGTPGPDERPAAAPEDAS